MSTSVVSEAGQMGRCSGCSEVIVPGDPIGVLEDGWVCEGCLDGLVFDALDDWGRDEAVA